MDFSLSPTIDPKLKDELRLLKYKYAQHAEETYTKFKDGHGVIDFLALEEPLIKKRLQRQEQRKRLQARNEWDVLSCYLVEAWLEHKEAARSSLKVWLQYRVNSKKMHRLASRVCKTRAQRWMKMLDDSNEVGSDKTWMSTLSIREVGTMQPIGFAHGDGGGKVTILKETLVPLKTHRGKDRPRHKSKLRQVHLFEDDRLSVEIPSGPVPEPTPTITGWERGEVEHRGRSGLRRIERAKDQEAIAIK